MQIRDNTVIPNASDNSGIIPKSYNTKDSIKKDITSVPIDINKIIDENSDNYTNSAKSTCIDIIKSTINYTDSAKRTCINIIKRTINYTDNIKGTCIVIIKSTNVNNNYLHSIKSTCIDITKSNNVNNKYIDNIKSTTGNHIKSTDVNNKYIDNIIHKCVDKKNNIIAPHKNINNKSAYEISALLKGKKVTNISKNIIISKKTNHQAAIIKYELNMLSKL